MKQSHDTNPSNMYIYANLTQRKPVNTGKTPQENVRIMKKADKKGIY